MSTVIKIENVSKQYRLGLIGTNTLKGDLQRWWYNMRGLPDPTLMIGQENSLNNKVKAKAEVKGRSPLTPHSSLLTPDEFVWALKDINLEVQQGEVLGIIGKNGAGKSTLLKLLSRVMAPTTGIIKVKGRIASLLEIGTGFHPELTGRENIFLNGAILGMTKVEIRSKFDEIVDFAGVAKYIDTPVKRYSSGMYVRLAFAVAAYLEPEILIVDEVLAVGDAEFQKKAIGKMQDVSINEGRTVLFVSHNMQAIRLLCNRAILLGFGRVILDGEPSKVIQSYLQINNSNDETNSIEEIIRNLPKDPIFKFELITLTQDHELVGRIIENGKPLEIEIQYQVFEKTIGLEVYFDLIDDLGNVLFRTFHDEDNDGIPVMEPGYYVSKATIPQDFLAPIKYELRILATIFNVRTFYPDGISIPLNVVRTGKANRAYISEPIYGKLAPLINWETRIL